MILGKGGLPGASCGSAEWKHLAPQYSWTEFWYDCIIQVRLGKGNNGAGGVVCNSGMEFHLPTHTAALEKDNYPVLSVGDLKQWATGLR